MCLLEAYVEKQKWLDSYPYIRRSTTDNFQTGMYFQQNTGGTVFSMPVSPECELAGLLLLFSIMQNNYTRKTAPEAIICACCSLSLGSSGAKSIKKKTTVGHFFSSIIELFYFSALAIRRTALINYFNLVNKPCIYTSERERERDNEL